MTKRRFFAGVGTLVLCPLAIIYHKEILAVLVLAAQALWQWLTMPLLVDTWVLLVLGLFAFVGLLITLLAFLQPRNAVLIQHRSNKLGVVDGIAWYMEYGELVGFCGVCDMRLTQQQDYGYEQQFCEQCQERRGKRYGLFGESEYKEQVLRKLEWKEKQAGTSISRQK